jgi:hypothetical protein
MPARLIASSAALAVGAALLIAPPPAAAGSECSAFGSTPEFAGTVPTAEEVLGFDLGDQETSPRQIQQFVAAVDAASDRVTSGSAATSVNGRPLPYAVVGDPSSVTPEALDVISDQAQRLRDPQLSAAATERLVNSTPAILWVAGNVHGTEESGADAALQVLYELADRTDCVADTVLGNAIVVILPTQNPDGRFLDTRRNAYGFDMNRDWFARTQPETDGKLEMLRRFPPMLFIDAHEFGYSDFLFPPHADPEYAETPDTAHDWIFDDYSPAIVAEFEREKLNYHHGAPYDFFATIFGDTVPAVGFHGAGMTFEKDNRDRIVDRTFQQFLAMWASVFQGATGGTDYVRQWHDSYVEAYQQGVDGELESNEVFNPKNALFQDVPDQPVRNYFLLDRPNRAYETQTLIRRLTRMDVEVYRLTAPIEVGDFHAYGEAGASRTLPAGTYWIPMAQGQKHWVQAMLHEETYIPYAVTYDVTSWSNPLLMNLEGGWTGDVLTPRAEPVGPTPVPSWDSGANLPRVGLFEIPNSSRGFESAGQTRYVFENMWQLPYRTVTTNQIIRGLQDLDVLVVPDGYSNYAMQALGSAGKRALKTWVADGGRFVGWQGGTRVAIKAGLSSAKLSGTHANAPGTLIRTTLDTDSPLATGIGSTVWVMYDNNDTMTSRYSVGEFPAPGSNDFATSGLAEGIDQLTGTGIVADEPLADGRVVTFAIDPNFRAWTLGTHRLLWNAITGPDPTGTAQARLAPAERSTVVARAQAAERRTPEIGDAIRIAVPRDQAAEAKAALRPLGLTVRTIPAGNLRIITVANVEHLGLEESRPLSLVMTRVQQAGVTVEWASLPGP